MLGLFPSSSKLNLYGSNLTPQTNLEGPNFKKLLLKGNHLVIEGLKCFFSGTQLKGKALCLVL